MAAVPAEVVEAAVQVCGKAFHYHEQLRALFLGAGVPASVFDQYAVKGVSKYVVARRIFTHLTARGVDGHRVASNVVGELANMTRPAMTAPNQAGGQQAIADLKRLALARRVLLDTDAAERDDRRREQEQRVGATRVRQEALAALAVRLGDLSKSAEPPQRRGYQLEQLLVDLFRAHGLAYRAPYRSAREQIDGAFEYKSFTYLVEARWRSRPPDFGDLADFKGKVDGKLESTRGVFLSMSGFDTTVVAHFMGAARGTRNNLLLIDGQDLALIMQGGVSLPDALDYKIQAASHEGKWWAPLSERT